MRRLLIISCSQRKQLDQELLPAINRYNGPAFFLLRRFLREQSEEAENLVVYVLSAAYGLIPSEQPIPKYDHEMTSQRALELNRPVLRTLNELFNSDYSGICLAMSNRYLKSLNGWQKLLSPNISVVITSGAQGLKLTQLKSWLYRMRVTDTVRKQDTVKISGVARLRGVELRLTSKQVLEQAKLALAEDSIAASRYNQWYVRVGNNVVSPKWLVSKLTGLPVKLFTAGEARRVLGQLGVATKRLQGTANEN